MSDLEISDFNKKVLLVTEEPSIEYFPISDGTDVVL